MLYLKLYKTKEDFTAAETVTPTEEYVSSVIPGVAAVKEDKKNAWYNQVPSDKKLTVAELIAEGYGRKVPGNHGTCIEIFTSCPYKMSQIIDLEEVALNQKKIDEGVSNVIVWDDTLPNGWSSSDVYSIYNGKSINCTPIGRMFWGLTDIIETFEITFPNFTSWSLNGFPWDDYAQCDGVFAPRYREDREEEYAQKHFRATPKNVIINFPKHFSSVAQVMCAQMEQTTAITLNCATNDVWNNLWECHDVIGMFENCYRLKVLNVTGGLWWKAMSSCLNMFRGCGNLERIPYSTIFGTRTSDHNTIYPHAFRVNNSTRGTADTAGMFNATGLKYIGPVINMYAVSLVGCTVDGVGQSKIGDSYTEPERPFAHMFNCGDLEDVLLKNLNNNDWNFADYSTHTYIPKMNVDSINYLLNNVADCSATPHTVTFSTLHQGEIDASAISAAAAKGWTVAYQAA